MRRSPVRASPGRERGHLAQRRLARVAAAQHEEPRRRGGGKPWALPRGRPSRGDQTLGAARDQRARQQQRQQHVSRVRVRWGRLSALTSALAPARRPCTGALRVHVTTTNGVVL